MSEMDSELTDYYNGLRMVAGLERQLDELADAAQELARALWDVQDWDGTRVGACLDELEAALQKTGRDSSQPARRRRKS